MLNVQKMSERSGAKEKVGRRTGRKRREGWIKGKVDETEKRR